MNALKWMVAGAALGVIVVAFRDFENQRWLVPAPAGAGGWDYEDEETEPVLGYDGMDQETIVDWLADASPAREVLLRMRRYEEEHLGREPVLAAIDDLL